MTIIDTMINHSRNWKQVLGNLEGKPEAWLGISLVDLVKGMNPGR